MTGISYLDETWQVVTGCTPCSPGCEHCYAAKQASGPRLRNHRRYEGLAEYGDWTGLVRCNDADLTQPLRWQIPRTIGPGFMGDLYHPDVPDAFLDKVFAVMALCPQHTFVLCTKRAERMRKYLSTPGRSGKITCAEEAAVHGTGFKRHKRPWEPSDFPLQNVHLGVTVESFAHSYRARVLAETPAAHRWISYEPALDECTSVLPLSDFCMPCDGDNCRKCRGTGQRKLIDGVIIGCESGPNRRPFDLAWARQVRDDCAAAGVLLYVKQLPVDGKVSTDPATFPADLQSRELPWKLRK